MQTDERGLVERSDDQQDDVGAIGACLPKLVGGDREVLAQYGNVNGCTDRIERVIRPS